MRNKWKTAYDSKVDEILGIRAATARSRLDRVLILELAKKLGKDKCPYCPFKIENINEMSIEHIKPWGGNNARGCIPNKDLFWDINNICLAHKDCNTSAACAGTGVYSYIGVHDFFDKRNKKDYHYMRAELSLNSKGKIMGCYKDPEEAAVAYDLGIILFKKGKGRLNFEKMRENYNKIIENDEYLKSAGNIDQVDNLKFSRKFINKIKEYAKNIKENNNLDEARVFICSDNVPSLLS